MNFKRNFSSEKLGKKGFTLVEVLIVIAMIGVLSTIILFALKPSRDKAKDTKIIANLNELRAMSASYYDPLKGEYDANFNIGTGSGTKLWQEIKNMGITECGIYANSDIQLCGSSPQPSGDVVSNSIAFYAKLLKGSYYCVDTLGNTSSIKPTSPQCK